MKHLLYLLLLSTIVFTACRNKSQSYFQPDTSVQSEETEELTEEYSEEVIITGKVLNKEFYPNEKELTLVMPFFRDMENQYRTPIQEDGSFSFRFPIFAKIREVSIRNYAEHLYVRPGDSLYVEIDFKDMFHPKVAGEAEKLNQQILAFTENAYYYIKDYSLGGDLDFKSFESELKKEYQLRLERRGEYLQKYKPMEDAALVTEELLKQDYYLAVLQYANRRQSRTGEDLECYRLLLPEINKLYKTGILSARLFDVADAMEEYILYGVVLKDRKVPTIEEMMNITGGKALNQYLYVKVVTNILEANDTVTFSEMRPKFDSIVKMPHLRAQVMQIYKQTKSFLDNPQSVTDNLLYGKYNESSRFKAPMPYMQRIYDILDKEVDKVIYLEFWTTWCPPCLQEMKPLKKLRDKYLPEDLIIYSVCVSGAKEQWQECLDKYSLEVDGIECIYAADYFGKEDYQKISKQMNINAFPYYFLINRKGQIIDFGTMARPSNPRFLVRIDEAIRQAK